MNFFFLKIFTRNLSRQGMFSFINIAGLAIGLTVVLLICAFIFNEYSFDKSFTHHRQIYRVNSEISLMGTEGVANVSVVPLAPAAKEDISGVEAAVRVHVLQVSVRAGDVPFIEKFCWTDKDFFFLFNTPFIYGSPEEIFAQPGMVALSESKSKVFFGDKNPIGEILMLDNLFPMEVRAVYKDFPVNSSLHGHQMIGHLMAAPDHQGWIKGPHWGSIQCETYCLLAPGVDAAVVEAGIQQLVEKNLGGTFFKPQLQPFGKIHLYSKEILLTEHLTTNHGDIRQVKLFSLLAAIVLLVACINYMNLSTARAQKRSKEIGISKTVGAKRREIIWRLYAETGMFTFLSFAVAFVLAFMALPVFNMILGQDIHPEIFLNAKLLLGMLAVYLVTTFIAASYPALYLSGFASVMVIRQSAFTKGSSHALVRKGLSVVQFSVAVILIVWVIVIQTQMSFVNNKDKGYNVHHVVGFPIPNQSVLDALKNDFAAQESVSAVAFASGFPMGTHSGRDFYKSMADMRERQNNMVNAAGALYMSKATPESIDLLQMKLIAGRTLPESRPGDTITSMVINRKAVEFMETTPEEAIGTRLPVGFNQPVYVCGVVEDFHFQSLYETVRPFGLHNWNNQGFTHLLLKVKERNMPQQLLTYEEIFRKHFPNDVFEAQFPDLIMAKAYEEDRRTGVIVLGFSILAILVACLGVFGLTAFMAEQRAKEIGIRKVFGASVVSIVRLFTDNYLRLLALSLVIVIPVAWWIGSRYLEDFAYHISLAWWMFAAAALITIVLTLFTVGWQAIKAATANPVKSIKVE